MRLHTPQQGCSWVQEGFPGEPERTNRTHTLSSPSPIPLCRMLLCRRSPSSGDHPARCGYHCRRLSLAYVNVLSAVGSLTVKSWGECLTGPSIEALAGYRSPVCSSKAFPPLRPPTLQSFLEGFTTTTAIADRCYHREKGSAS